MRKKQKLLNRNFSSAVGKRLALIRNELEYTRSEMALKLGIHRITFIKMKSDTQFPA